MANISWITEICDMYIPITHFISLHIGTQSEGLRDLKEVRRIKYNKKPPQRTALDDLWSLEKKSRVNEPIGGSQRAGRSNIPEEISAAESTEASTDDDIPPGITFDQLHPPSPKVPKGGKVKSSKKVQESIILKNNDSCSSSDVDIRLSGKVAIANDNTTSGTEDDDSGRFTYTCNK